MARTEPVDPRPILDYALTRCPELLQITGVEEILYGSARASGGKPARIELQVPDERVKNLRGKPEQRDVLLLLRVPAEVVARSKRLIILPGELA